MTGLFAALTAAMFESGFDIEKRAANRIGHSQNREQKNTMNREWNA
jgi:hypothetical protein